MEVSFIIKSIVIVINFFGIWLAVLVSSRKPRSKISFLFISMVFLMFIWVDFAYLARITSNNYGLLFIRSAWAITPLFFIIIFLFIKNFLEKRESYSISEYLLLGVGIINVPIVLLTSFVIKNIFFDEKGVLKITYGGGGEWVFFAEVFLLTALSFYILYRGYIKSASKKEKTKIAYLLIGMSFFFLMNALFNIISPVFFKVFNLYEFGDYSTIILISIIAYTVIKKELFDIKVILATVWVGLIAVLLLLDTFVFTKGFTLQIFKSLTLIIFLFFGYSLVKSVLKEEKNREQAEELAQKEKRQREEAQYLVKEFKHLNEAKTQFMLATQHHLRTPLTAMIGYLDLIFDGTYGNISPEIKKALLKFKVSTQRLNKIVDQLLDVSRFQIGKKVVTLKPEVDIELILEEIIEELKFEADSKNIYLKLEKSKNLPLIKADPEKLRVALTNIIDNAIKYTRKGGVKIKTKARDSKVLILIKDTGIGIPLGEEKNIFSRIFERGEKAKKVHVTGKGIGLFITSQIIKAHQGKVWAESEGENKGSIFYIELPV